VLEYVLTNHSSSPIRLLGSPPSCGLQACLNVRGLPASIAPHGSLALTLDVETRKPCEFEGRKTIYTDCPGTPQIDLVIRGRIESEARPLSVASSMATPDPFRQGN
jgi:hypothetical protein